jgi:hypothetical protein
MIVSAVILITMIGLVYLKSFYPLFVVLINTPTLMRGRVQTTLLYDSKQQQRDTSIPVLPFSPYHIVSSYTHDAFGKLVLTSATYTTLSVCPAVWGIEKAAEHPGRKPA